LIAEFARVRAAVPEATFVIAGEGYLRGDLETAIAAIGAQSWISLPGRISDEELRDLYRRAWVVTSNSLREGWGMTITEAAACATPSVVIDIAGHRDAIDPDISGVLVPVSESLGDAIADVLLDFDRLTALRAGAERFAQEFSWEATALSLFELLLEDARRR
jgi:glycosyltransferase involved in cell wall biosynthesis